MYNIEWGVCMPDVCTKEDVSKNFEFLFNNGKHFFFPSSFKLQQCCRTNTFIGGGLS